MARPPKAGASLIAAERPSLTNGGLAPIVDGRANEFRFRIVEDDAIFPRFWAATGRLRGIGAKYPFSRAIESHGSK
jgi:hypothetical protein